MKNKTQSFSLLLLLIINSSSVAKNFSDNLLDLLSAEANNTHLHDEIPIIANIIKPKLVLFLSNESTNPPSNLITKQRSDRLGNNNNHSLAIDITRMNNLSSVVHAAMTDIETISTTIVSKEVNPVSAPLNKLIRNTTPTKLVKNLKPEEILIIKAPIMPTQNLPKTVTVQKGESLYKVALRVYGHGGSYMRLFNANKKILSDPNIIQAGQQLQVAQ